VLQVVRHVGRVAMHGHVHGYIDTHTGEHVMVLGGRLGPSCGPGAEHPALVLSPRAELRSAVASTRRHHLQHVLLSLYPVITTVCVISSFLFDMC
jgi:hypothetical protein